MNKADCFFRKRAGTHAVDIWTSTAEKLSMQLYKDYVDTSYCGQWDRETDRLVNFMRTTTTLCSVYTIYTCVSLVWTWTDAGNSDSDPDASNSRISGIRQKCQAAQYVYILVTDCLMTKVYV